MTLEGTENHPLTDFPSSGPVWSRDSKQIACFAYLSSKVQGYYLLDREDPRTDASKLHRLFVSPTSDQVTATGILLPPVGEDPDKIIFTLIDGEAMHLFTMMRKEAQPTWVVPRETRYDFLQWVRNPYFRPPVPTGPTP